MTRKGVKTMTARPQHEKAECLRHVVAEFVARHQFLSIITSGLLAVRFVP